MKNNTKILVLVAKLSGHIRFPCSVITVVKIGYYLYNTTRKCDYRNSGVFSHEGMVADCVWFIAIGYHVFRDRTPLYFGMVCMGTSVLVHH